MFCKDGFNMKCCTIASLKLAVAAFVLGLIKLWPAAMTWVHNTNIWWFVGAFVLFSIKPLMTVSGSCAVAPSKK
jgi:hypothetical protein